MDGWSVLVTNPDAVKTILYKTELQKQRMLIAKFFGRNNLAGANGHEWKRRRKIVYPAFRRSMPAKTFAIDKTEGSVDIQGLLQRFTLDAIGRIGFGFEFNATNSSNDEWVLTYNDVADNIGDFRFLFFPSLDSTFLGLFPERQKKHQSLDRLNKLFDEIIEHKRAELAKGVSSAVEENEKDPLTLMIEAGGEDDTVEPLSAQELRDEVVLFFLAGHDTTSSAMTAVLYFLAANQDIQAKARKEVLDILGDEKFDVWPTLQQLKEFTYLTKIMKEAIRLAPPAAGLVDRLATEDTELAGTHIPKGTIIKLDIVAMHYNYSLWEDPTKFDPDRFAEGGELESMPSTYAYLPFGGGSRQCIGMNFSLAEQRVALSSILRKYELSLPDDSIHKDGLVFNSSLLIFTAKEMKLNFTRRY
ncbi:cytochrome P450 [Umbelopsis sp. PMI_123]|nr:cytochrome P450 [Umbelopsis sp. PMI_123]